MSYRVGDQLFDHRHEVSIIGSQQSGIAGDLDTSQTVPRHECIEDRLASRLVTGRLDRSPVVGEHRRRSVESGLQRLWIVTRELDRHGTTEQTRLHPTMEQTRQSTRLVGHEFGLRHRIQSIGANVGGHGRCAAIVEITVRAEGRRHDDQKKGENDERTDAQSIRLVTPANGDAIDHDRLENEKSDRGNDHRCPPRRPPTQQQIGDSALSVQRRYRGCADGEGDPPGTMLGVEERQHDGDTDHRPRSESRTPHEFTEHLTHSDSIRRTVDFSPQIVTDFADRVFDDLTNLRRDLGWLDRGGHGAQVMHRRVDDRIDLRLQSIHGFERLTADPQGRRVLVDDPST